MNEIMKQRLVGAIVLGCLAIIFVPIFLDGEGISSPDSVTIEVPINPVPPNTPDNLLTEQEVILPQTDPPQVETVDPDTMQSEELDNDIADAPLTDMPTMDADGLPQGWVVRLGAFSDRANAEALEQRLLSEDMKAYIRPVSENEGSLAGVYVGPVLTRADAEQLRQELAQSLELEGVVESFSVDN